MKFHELGLHETILKNLDNLGFESPTPIQEEVIPHLLGKKDVVMQSHTGSGKTAAFGLPIIQAVHNHIPATQFLVLVPTRELAMQVQGELTRLAQGLDVQAVAIYGGVSMSAQVEQIKKTPQLIVGTPGRILDHLKRRNLNFSVVRGVVLDEADKMLSMGFLPEVQLIFRHLPKRRQVTMSSATFPVSIENLILSYMNEPLRIDVSSDASTAKEIEHYYCITTNQTKDQSLLAFIEKEEPDQSLIFCNTKIEVKALTTYLKGAGLKAISLSSELSQNARERNLERLRRGFVNHLVCTDVAARGIDIPNLTHVFIYSASEDLETYVHRTGRTGRAGKKGKAISLVSGQDLANFTMALKSHEIEAIEIQSPEEEEIIQTRVQRDMTRLQDINFAREADIPKEYTRLASDLSEAEVQSLLPLLLEKFFRPETMLATDLIEETQVEREAPSAPKAPSSSAPSNRDPKKTKFKTMCIALGTRDGLHPTDLIRLLGKLARVRESEIGRIKMGDYESWFNISARAKKAALKTNGKMYHHTPILIVPSENELSENGDF